MKELSRLAISNDNFAFDPTTGQSFSINKTCKDAIKFLIDGHDEKDLIKYFCEKYQVSEDEAYIDVMDLFTKLKIYNLIGQL